MPLFRKNRALFRLLGFPIRIHPTWLLLLGLIVYSLAGSGGLFRELLHGPVREATFWLLGVLGALGLFASLIVHELCHSLVARHTGMPVKGITLFIFGGVSELGDMPPTPIAEFVMAVVGPLSSLAIACCCALVWLAGRFLSWPGTVSVLFGYLALVNIVLALFNSLPAFPLDGGRVLRSILWGISRNLRAATTVAAWAGSAFGIMMVVGGVLLVFHGGLIGGIWLIFIGFFLGQAARSSLQQTIMREELMGERVARFMKPQPVTVRPDMSLRIFVDEYVMPYHFAAFPVVDDEGRLVGIIGSRDPARVERASWETLTIADIMSEATEGIKLAPDTPAVEAFVRLASEQGKRLVVVEDDRPVGMLSLRDLLEFLALKIDLGVPRRRL